MANVFWVSGGTGNTNSTTNWSASSGGSSGAAAPTAGDDAIFDNHSGTNTITVNAAFTCHSWDMSTSGSRTVAGSSTIAIGGVATLTTAAIFKIVSGITWTQSGIITLDNRSGGTTVTTAGATLPTVTIASTNTAAVLFADSINCSGGTSGILNTAGTGAITFTSGITVTCKIFQVNGASSAITYSGVTINCNGTGTPIQFLAAPTVTGNSSSQLNATAWTTGTCNFSTASLPGTVTLTHAGNTNGLTQSGVATFVNLTLNGAALAQTSCRVTMQAITVSGVLTIAGASQRQRLLILGAGATLPATGIPTITCNGTATLSNVDFQAVTAGGSTAPWSGTSVGIAGATTNITATTPTTVYWVGGNSGNWSTASKWATGSGGSGGSAGLPLPQDTVVFDAATGGITANSSTVTCDSLCIGALNTSAVAATGFVISYGSTLPLTFRDSITLSSTTTVSASSSIVLQWLKDSGTITITQNGGLITTAAQVAGTLKKSSFYSSTTVVGASVWTNLHLEVAAGTLDISSGALDAWAFLVGGSGSVVFGGYFYTFRANDSTQTAGFVTSSAAAGNITGLVGAQIKLLNSGASINTGNNTTVDVMDLTQASGTIFTTGASKINTLALPPGLTFSLSAGFQLTIKMLEAIGTSGSLITFKTSSAGVAATLSCAKGIINLDWVSIKDITASGGATFYPGPNSTYSTGNSGWQVSGSTPLSGPARQQGSMTGCGGY